MKSRAKPTLFTVITSCCGDNSYSGFTYTSAGLRYKQILSWPLLMNDLEALDDDVMANLLKVIDLPPDQIEYLCLDFTATENVMGKVQEVVLKEGGADIEVTKDNLEEYIR